MSCEKEANFPASTEEEINLICAENQGVLIQLTNNIKED